MIGKSKAVPPDDPDYGEWIDTVTWRLSRMLSNYTQARAMFKYLRQVGYLSNNAISDHELAYDYAMRAGDDENVKRYFAFIMKNQSE